MTFESLALLLETAEKNNIPLWQQISNTDRHESGLTAAEEYERMNRMWQAMKKAAQSYDRTLFSRSGLSGTEGGLFEDYVEKGATICGPFMGAVIAQAIQMGESNACMKCIVAAPTAGSCGVLPAVLIPLAATGHITEEQAVHALFIASGIGQIIANRASISGAEGGCQAEIGAAAAMAAGALVYLYNGTNDQIAAACGFALQNLLGLVCDPVAGLVEIPCIKRNVIGAVNACSAADMALAGLSLKIPADQIIDALKEIGDVMPDTLKETGCGGLAATPEADAVKKMLKA